MKNKIGDCSKIKKPLFIYVSFLFVEAFNSGSNLYSWTVTPESLYEAYKLKNVWSRTEIASSMANVAILPHLSAKGWVLDHIRN